MDLVYIHPGGVRTAMHLFNFEKSANLKHPSDHQFFLKSNNFHENTGKAFNTFKEGNDFTDVTLVSEDGQEIKVHKIVLAASSFFFMRMLEKKKTNHSHHPLIYLRGITSDIHLHCTHLI